MAEDNKDAPYNPEPGSALADIAKTEELERDQQMQEEWTKAQGGSGEHFEYSRDWERWSEEQRVRDETMEDVHIERQLNPNFQTIEGDPITANDLSNMAYAYAREHTVPGESNDWDLRVEFYKQVYPELENYLASRTAQPNESPYQPLEDFLLGKDLKTSK